MPTSASAARTAIEPAETRFSGRSQTTSAAPSGRQMRAVVSYFTATKTIAMTATDDAIARA